MNCSFSTFFSKLQESPWYNQFLTPVINAIPNEAKVLDVGTGSGKMLELLLDKKGIAGVGIDTDIDMLEEAKSKLNNTGIVLRKVDSGQNFPFADNSFDCVTICNVLFNLKRIESIDHILFESLRVLNTNGRIIILNPSGMNSLIDLTRRFFSMKNMGIYIWYNATRKNAKKWSVENYLFEFASENRLNYKKEESLQGFAQIEVIIK